MVGWHHSLTRIVTGLTRMLYRWLGVSNNMEDDRLLILANTCDRHAVLLRGINFINEPVRGRFTGRRNKLSALHRLLYPATEYLREKINAFVRTSTIRIAGNMSSANDVAHRHNDFFVQLIVGHSTCSAERSNPGWFERRGKASVVSNK